MANSWGEHSRLTSADGSCGEQHERHSPNSHLLFTCDKRNHSLTTSVDFLDHKMSSSMFAEIPKLTCSTDYPRWAQTITAYLRVQKAWKTVVKSRPAYIKVEGGDDNQVKIDA